MRTVMFLRRMRRRTVGVPHFRQIALRQYCAVGGMPTQCSLHVAGRRSAARQANSAGLGAGTMRIFLTVGLFEVVVLAAVLFFASAAAAEWVSAFDRMEQPGHDPCRDGRYGHGRAMRCDELPRPLDREEEERRFRRRSGEACGSGQVVESVLVQ
jgi:hypothetical protein